MGDVFNAATRSDGGKCPLCEEGRLAFVHAAQFTLRTESDAEFRSCTSTDGCVRTERRRTRPLRPYPAELMEAMEANPLVNSPKNEGPALLDPAA